MKSIKKFLRFVYRGEDYDAVDLVLLFVIVNVALIAVIRLWMGVAS